MSAHASAPRYGAQIIVQGKTEYLGTFAHKRAAALAYDKRARQLGRTRRLNFPPSHEVRGRSQAENRTARGWSHNDDSSSSNTGGDDRLRRKASSRFRSVCWEGSRQKWRALAPGSGRLLGRFSDEDEAAAAIRRHTVACGTTDQPA